jgi:hypothetical protein
MANIRKQFNFRNGVQVDDDNLVVSPTGLVGIGTTIPTEILDVRGTAKVVGLVTASQIYTPSLTATNLTIDSLVLGNFIIGGGVSIRSGIITASGTGVVTYYGDGGRLSNLPTSQWLDTDVGLGFTSIYSQGFVGVGTNDPRFLFQVSGTNSTTLGGFASGVGFSSEGNILATGIVTASKFVGVGSDLTGLNASNIAYGTIDNDRIPTLLNSKLPSNIIVSGIITATGGFIGTVAGNIFGNVTGNVTGNLTGNVTGIASTARTLTGNPDILVNNITATSIAVTSISASSIGCTGVNATGIITSAAAFNVGLGGTIVTLTSDGRIGIGSATPEKEIQIVKNSVSTVEVVGSEARILLAQQTSNVSFASSAAIIQYGNSDKTFELKNQASGDFNFYLHSGGPGINTGGFGWINGQNFSELMSLTYEGKLGLGKTNPDRTLDIVGTSSITSNAWFGNDVDVVGTLRAGNLSFTSFTGNVIGNVYSISGVSTFNDVDITRIGINTNLPLVDVDAQNSVALFSAVGVGTTNPGTAKFKVDGGFAEFDAIGIGTAQLYDVPGDGNSGNLQLHQNSLSVFGASILVDSSPVSSIGFGTFIPRTILDFGNVGSAASTGFMILPTLTSSQRTNLAYNLGGGILYNSSLTEFQGYNGSSWINLGIQTASINSNQIDVSGVTTTSQLKVGTGVTINSGIVTAVNGFNSGIGTAVKITTIGNKIIFTVPGVGTTSLTLF